MSNKRRGTLYVGVTSDLVRRVWQHKSHVVDGFTTRYGLNKLVYYERFSDMYGAIKREKSIKNWKRIWKIELIENSNPGWEDLYYQVC
jgi:putative endonuclease